MFKDWVVTDQNWYLVTNKLEQNSTTILKGLCALHGTMLHSLGIICEVAMYLISSFLLLSFWVFYGGILFRRKMIAAFTGQWLRTVVGYIEL